MYYVYFLFFLINFYGILTINEEFLVFFSIVVFFFLLYILGKKSLKLMFFYKVERIYLYFAYLLSLTYRLTHEFLMLAYKVEFTYQLNIDIVDKYFENYIWLNYIRAFFIKQQLFLKVELFSIFSKLCYYSKNLFLNNNIFTNYAAILYIAAYKNLYISGSSNLNGVLYLLRKYYNFYKVELYVD